MTHGNHAASIISEIPVTRDYGTTVLMAAHHRQCVPREANAVILADELGKRPDVEVIAIVDAERRPVGVITRVYLFSLLGKPFGREVLGKTAVWELAEAVPLMDSHAGLFSADTANPAAYRILVDGEGRFLAILASRDLARHLSRMTEDDIELARRIQERLEAGNEPVVAEGVFFEAWSRPARGVGGDFWYSRRLADDSWFLALCDVSGKGVAASLVVALVSGMLRMYDFDKGLGALIGAVNEALVTTFHLEKYLTGFFCIFNPDTHIIQIADMGHSHAFVFRNGHALRLKVAVANLPVGIEPHLEPCMHRWRIESGDTLLVYSDGITEQEDPLGKEFGDARLASFVLGALQSGTCLRDSLPSALDLHRLRIPQQDDMSFMALRLE